MPLSQERRVFQGPFIAKKLRFFKKKHKILAYLKNSEKEYMTKTLIIKIPNLSKVEEKRVYLDKIPSTLANLIAIIHTETQIPLANLALGFSTVSEKHKNYKQVLTKERDIPETVLTELFANSETTVIAANKPPKPSGPSLFSTTPSIPSPTPLPSSSIPSSSPLLTATPSGSPSSARPTEGLAITPGSSEGPVVAPELPDGSVMTSGPPGGPIVIPPGPPGGPIVALEPSGGPIVTPALSSSPVIPEVVVESKLPDISIPRRLSSLPATLRSTTKILPETTIWSIVINNIDITLSTWTNRIRIVCGKLGGVTSGPLPKTPMYEEVFRLLSGRSAFPHIKVGNEKVPGSIRPIALKKNDDMKEANYILDQYKHLYYNEPWNPPTKILWEQTSYLVAALWPNREITLEEFVTLMTNLMQNHATELSLLYSSGLSALHLTKLFILATASITRKMSLSQFAFTIMCFILPYPPQDKVDLKQRDLTQHIDEWYTHIFETEASLCPYFFGAKTNLDAATTLYQEIGQPGGFLLKLAFPFIEQDEKSRETYTICGFSLESGLLRRDLTFGTQELDSPDRSRDCTFDRIRMLHVDSCAQIIETSTKGQYRKSSPATALTKTEEKKTTFEEVKIAGQSPTFFPLGEEEKVCDLERDMESLVKQRKVVKVLYEMASSTEILNHWNRIHCNSCDYIFIPSLNHSIDPRNTDVVSRSVIVLLGRLTSGEWERLKEYDKATGKAEEAFEKMIEKAQNLSHLQKDMIVSLADLGIPEAFARSITATPKRLTGRAC